MTTPLSRSPHVAPESIAAFLDGRLHGAERALVAEHLSECADCRRELIDTRRAIRALTMRRVIGVTAGLALAASLALVLLPPNWRGRPGASDAARLRGPEQAGALVAHGPLGDVADIRPHLTWSPAAAGAVYRVTVTAASGAPVWRASTADTIAVPPDTVSFAPGVTYRWWVDAVLADGATRSTGVREFRVR
jgi:anti-sigma factor RsiW